MTTPASAPSAVFYRYENAEGRPTIVDSPNDVPESLRGKAERIELAPRAAEPGAPGSTPPLHWPSFGVGFGAAVLLALALFVLRGRRSIAKVVLASALAVAVVALVGAAYLGLLRRITGQSGSTLGSPVDIVDDARKAVEKAERRNERQKRLLDEIERETRSD